MRGFAPGSVLAVLSPLALAASWPAAAQEPLAGDAPAGNGSRAGEAEIVVHGVRLRDPEDLPVSVRPPMGSSGVTRTMSAESASFARCAGPPRPSLLHRILDGRPNSGETQGALHQHIMRNSGCFQDIPSLPPYPKSPYFGACNPRWIGQDAKICRADYDRGFVFEQALRDYAPDLRLSRSNTFDHATRDRFRVREEARNSARSGRGAGYFFTVSCLVQVSPEYALALLHEAPGSDREEALRAMMISDGVSCLGGAAVENVRVDPGQFRAYVAEAVYSWAVAVKRTASLVPPEEEQ